MRIYEPPPQPGDDPRWLADPDLGTGPRRRLPRKETRWGINKCSQFFNNKIIILLSSTLRIRNFLFLSSYSPDSGTSSSSSTSGRWTRTRKRRNRQKQIALWLPLSTDNNWKVKKTFQVSAGLKELRNQMVFSFLMINGIWVVSVFLLQENQVRGIVLKCNFVVNSYKIIFLKKLNFSPGPNQHRVALGTQGAECHVSFLPEFFLKAISSISFSLELPLKKYLAFYIMINILNSQIFFISNQSI